MVPNSDRRTGSKGPPPPQRVNVGKQTGKFPGMVGWYDPGQLAKTAMEVLVSAEFGRKADRRLESFGPPLPPVPFDYTRDARGEPRSGLWLDYVSDLGDGWNSTYSVAYALSRQSLKVGFAGGEEYNLPRGDVLLFGGDQVYPTASRKEYQDRLLRPYETALRDSAAPSPDVYAIPGNHDWYDNLVAFTRLFCTGRWFAGWRTRQQRSYFALKLPFNWWLIGTDVQFDSDIDAPQLKYFKEIAQQMGDDDKIILMLAEPHWISARLYNKYDTDYNESNLAFLEQKVFHRKIAVYLAGDLHHYRRHEDASGCQKITSGGGGAFLYPTHGQDVDRLAGGYELKQNFPSKEDSRKLTWKNLKFPFINPLFGLVTGIIYLLIAWGVKADLSQFGIGETGSAISFSFRYLLQSQAAALWAFLLIGGFILFTETHSRLYRAIAGPLHALAHLSAVFFTGWAATSLSVRAAEFGSAPQLLLAGAIVFALGWLIGPFIMGVYFLISLNVFGRHAGEAFSSLRIEDYKHFIRMHVSESGLTIYPIKLERVWRNWKVNPGGIEEPELVPVINEYPSHKHHSHQGPATQPSLIEPPISYVCNRAL